MLPWIWSVIDHCGRHNVLRTSVTHSAVPHVTSFWCLLWSITGIYLLVRTTSYSRTNGTTWKYCLEAFFSVVARLGLYIRTRLIQIFKYNVKLALVYFSFSSIIVGCSSIKKRRDWSRWNTKQIQVSLLFPPPPSLRLFSLNIRQCYLWFCKTLGPSLLRAELQIRRSGFKLWPGYWGVFWGKVL